MFLGVAGFAQARKGGEKNKELRKTFLAEKLEITEAEGKLFWPIFEAHKENKKSMRKSLGEIKKSMDSDEDLTEKEMLSYSNKAKAIKVKELDMDHQFLSDILPILGVDRCKELKKMEKQFKNEMRTKRDGDKGQNIRQGRPAPSNQK